MAKQGERARSRRGWRLDQPLLSVVPSAKTDVVADGLPRGVPSKIRLLMIELLRRGPAWHLKRIYLGLVDQTEGVGIFGLLLELLHG